MAAAEPPAEIAESADSVQSVQRPQFFIGLAALDLNSDLVTLVGELNQERLAGASCRTVSFGCAMCC